MCLVSSLKTRRFKCKHFCLIQIFYKSLDCLDLKRLNKQHVESYQIINTIENGGHWKNHPAVRMWSKNVNALKKYFNINKQMCLDKGIKSNKLDFYDIKDNVVYPDWLGWKLFHIIINEIKFIVEGL